MRVIVSYIGVGGYWFPFAGRQDIANGICLDVWLWHRMR